MSASPHVLFVHHHLLPGGVSSVTRALAGALADEGWTCSLAVGGTLPPSWPFGACHSIPGLAYGAPADPAAVADTCRLLEAAARGGILHVQNLPLGKCPGLHLVVGELSRRGHRIVVHAHDFAEDGRLHLLTRLVRPELRFPYGPGLRWVTLSPSDERALLHGGMAVHTVSTLPNPVAAPFPDAAPPQWPLTLACPVRGLRRKNIGECVLWSCLAGDHATLLFPSAPLDPTQAREHKRWMNRVSTARGKEASCFHPTSAFHAALTTSVREGFGLASVEPWLSGHPVVGRFLADAQELSLTAGLQFPGHYSALAVPSSWPGARELPASLAKPLGPLAPLAISASTPAACPDMFDFGALSCEMQMAALDHIQKEASSAADIRVLPADGSPPIAWTHWWPSALERARSVIPHNQKAASFFAPKTVAVRWISLYRQLLASPPGVEGYACPDRIRSHFQRPERFRWLASESRPWHHDTLLRS